MENYIMVTLTQANKYKIKYLSECICGNDGLYFPNQGLFMEPVEHNRIKITVDFPDDRKTSIEESTEVWHRELDMVRNNLARLDQIWYFELPDGTKIYDNNIGFGGFSYHMGVWTGKDFDARLINTKDWKLIRVQ